MQLICASKRGANRRNCVEGCGESAILGDGARDQLTHACWDGRPHGGESTGRRRARARAYFK